MSMMYEQANDSLTSASRPFCCLYMTLMVSRQVEALPNIPNEASIKVAKEKRERLRKLGVTTADSTSDDFISLSLVTQDTSQDDQEPHPESRLQREDDDMGEGDDGESFNVGY